MTYHKSSDDIANHRIERRSDGVYAIIEGSVSYQSGEYTNERNRDIEAKVADSLEEIDATPNDNLRELVESWRGTAEMKHEDESEIFNAKAEEWEKAANELAELIEDD